MRSPYRESAPRLEIVKFGFAEALRPGAGSTDSQGR